MGLYGTDPKTGIFNGGLNHGRMQENQILHPSPNRCTNRRDSGNGCRYAGYDGFTIIHTPHGIPWGFSHDTIHPPGPDQVQPRQRQPRPHIQQNGPGSGAVFPCINALRLSAALYAVFRVSGILILSGPISPFLGRFWPT